MIDPSTLVEWQLVDESCDCVYPWFTHPFLDVLKSWDLSDKFVLEYGAGRSTAWWASKSKGVFSVEANEAWAATVEEELLLKGLTGGPRNKALVCYRQANEGETEIGKVIGYICAPQAYDYRCNIVVVDGILRNECLKKGIELLSERGGIIIADNWQQDYVWISEEAERIMAPYEIHQFIQPNHTNHEGRPWCTAYWEIPKS